MHTLILPLLLLLSPQSTSPAATLDYPQAKRLADRDEASVTGPAKQALLDAQAQLLDAGVAHCNLQPLRKDRTPFVVVMQLDNDGRITATWRQGESPLAICLQRFVRDQTLMKPPQAPFYAALEISFTP